MLFLSLSELDFSPDIVAISVLFSNLLESAHSIAKLVKKIVKNEFPNKDKIEIKKQPSNDNRSYHINSEKIFRVYMDSLIGIQPHQAKYLARKLNLKNSK